MPHGPIVHYITHALKFNWVRCPLNIEPLYSRLTHGANTSLLVVFVYTEELIVELVGRMALHRAICHIVLSE